MQTADACACSKGLTAPARRRASSSASENLCDEPRPASAVGASLWQRTNDTAASRQLNDLEGGAGLPLLEVVV